MKRILAGWLSESWIQKCWDSLVDGFCDLGGSLWLKALRKGRAPCAPFQLYLGICLKLSKRRENFSQCSRLGNRLFGAPTRFAASWAPSAGTSAFLVAEPRGFPHHIILSRNSWSVPWCQLKEWNSKFLVNLPVANLSRCVTRIAKTLGF
jgi:hypothetical protein